MKLLLNSAGLTMALAVFPALLFPQWSTYPTPGVPRLPDGKVNLDGPPPKAADGHPDLSGVWEYRADYNVPPPSGASNTFGPPPVPGTGRPSQFRDIGSTLKGGLPFLPAAKEILEKRKGENSKDNPDAHCLPLGLMQLHTHTQPRKIIQTPLVTVILYEAQGGVRQIFTDGRPLPTNDPQPGWYGYSVGHWDGDTLVVETNGFRDDVWLDIWGSPLTNAGKMTERFRRPTYGNLEIEVTVEDPTMYTKPWTVLIKQRVMVDTDLIEFVCAENEKSDMHLVGK
jgi:hypothetical protein